MKKIFAIALIAVALVAISAAPALAEGYNGYTFDGSGNFTDGPGDYTRANGYAAGPHGGYNSTTNKCQDCHSTHYAAGSYVLLRANSREQACDFCHVGGGGSSINIQMDNTYDAASVESTTSRGLGTGHTLGYAGAAPVDINPAFTSSEGLACFDCHTPHGNSARVLSTFANPGRAFEPTTAVVAVFGGAGVPIDDATFVANGGTIQPNGLYNLGTLADTVTYWGLTQTEGNINLAKGGDGKGVLKKPIWPTGRFLLIKNPDVEMVAGTEVEDTVVGDVVGVAGVSEGVNKFAIDWDDPLGPADDSYGGEQDLDYNKALPWNPSPADDPEFGSDNFGLASVSEFCTDCHDGAAGASTQQANVWYPDETTNDDTGSYTMAYSHDSQPRH